MTITIVAPVAMSAHQVKPAPAAVANVPPVRPSVLGFASTPLVTTTTVGAAAMSARLVNPARAEYVHVTQAPAPMAVVTRVASASREQLAATVGREASRV